MIFEIADNVSADEVAERLAKGEFFSLSANALSHLAAINYAFKAADAARDTSTRNALVQAIALAASLERDGHVTAYAIAREYDRLLKELGERYPTDTGNDLSLISPMIRLLWKHKDEFVRALRLRPELNCADPICPVHHSDSALDGVIPFELSQEAKYLPFVYDPAVPITSELVRVSLREEDTREYDELVSSLVSIEDEPLSAEERRINRLLAATIISYIRRVATYAAIRPERFQLFCERYLLPLLVHTIRRFFPIADTEEKVFNDVFMSVVEAAELYSSWGDTLRAARENATRHKKGTPGAFAVLVELSKKYGEAVVPPEVRAEIEQRYGLDVRIVNASELPPEALSKLTAALNSLR